MDDATKDTLRVDREFGFFKCHRCKREGRRFAHYINDKKYCEYCWARSRRIIKKDKDPDKVYCCWCGGVQPVRVIAQTWKHIRCVHCNQDIKDEYY